MTPKLLKTRLKKIDVHTGPGLGIDGAGQMNVEVEAGVAPVPANERQAAAQVTIKIEGIPKKAKDQTQYAFKAEIVILGTYEWPKKPPHNIDRELTNALCQPLYVMAVTDLTTLIPRTGAGLVRFPWTIDDGDDATPPPTKPASTKRAPAKGATPRAPRRKAIAV